MQRDGNVVRLETGEQRDAYQAARQRISDFLIRYALLESYQRSRADREAYRFVERHEVLPAAAPGSTERARQNTALIFLVDGELPRSLNKHFRLRASNRVTWQNLRRLAPHLDHSDYKASHCQLDALEFESLLRKLCTLDYALMIERRPGKDEADALCQITHMHVKVERLTDIAIKELGRILGYIDRRLFERGEDYVDALEAKFFEYYGFTYTASGRKSAAAMAAQLLAESRLRFSVFVSSQEDARLTVLDDGPTISQTMLVRFAPQDLQQLEAQVPGGIDRYIVDTADGMPVLLYQVRFHRTAAASISGGGLRQDRRLLSPWLEIADEAILDAAGSGAAALPVIWARNYS